MDFYDIIDKYKFYITTFIFFLLCLSITKKNELYGFRNNNDRKDL